MLKSGQYISTLYLLDRYSKTEIRDDDPYGNKNNEYSVNFRSYVGLTDNITLSASLSVHPEQTLSKRLYGDGGDRINSFHIMPAFVLSYRPKENIELFSSVDYASFTYSYKDSKSTIDSIIGFDNQGNPIYGTELIIPALPDMEVTSASVHVGVTFSGNLW